jgi:hypothetical protein
VIAATASIEKCSGTLEPINQKASRTTAEGGPHGWPVRPHCWQWRLTSCANSQRSPASVEVDRGLAVPSLDRSGQGIREGPTPTRLHGSKSASSRVGSPDPVDRWRHGSCRWGSLLAFVYSESDLHVLVARGLVSLGGGGGPRTVTGWQGCWAEPSVAVAVAARPPPPAPRPLAASPLPTHWSPSTPPSNLKPPLAPHRVPRGPHLTLLPNFSPLLRPCCPPSPPPSCTDTGTGTDSQLGPG